MVACVVEDEGRVGAGARRQAYNAHAKGEEDDRSPAFSSQASAEKEDAKNGRGENLQRTRS